MFPLETKKKSGRIALQSSMYEWFRKYPFDDFKKLAMPLAREGADITDLLFILVACNSDGKMNNKEIKELIALDSNVVNVVDRYGCSLLHLFEHDS